MVANEPVRYLNAEDPLAVAMVKGIHRGDAGKLRWLLAEHPSLALVLEFAGQDHRIARSRD
ncbi:hypothetical protein AB0G05_30520 [Nonomuraea wenchangensis]